MFHNSSRDVIDMSDVSELGVAREELRNVCKVMQYSLLFGRLDNRNKFRFVYLFDSHEHFNLNRVCQDRDNLTEEMKGCQEDSCLVES